MDVLSNLEAVDSFLAWRPGHFPFSQQVNMKVGNGLSTIGAMVDHKSEAVLQS